MLSENEFQTVLILSGEFKENFQVQHSEMA